MTVAEEVMKAYTDCWSDRPFKETKSERDLDFKASASLPRNDAVELLQRAIPGGYNKFEAACLLKLPEDCKITIAREGSVCVYVDDDVPDDLAWSMDVDENFRRNSVTRLWWD